MDKLAVEAFQTDMVSLTIRRLCTRLYGEEGAYMYMANKAIVHEHVYMTNKPIVHEHV